MEQLKCERFNTRGEQVAVVELVCRKLSKDVFKTNAKDVQKRK